MRQHRRVTDQRLSRDDLRRAGHELTILPVERAGGSKTWSGTCACGSWSGQSVAGVAAGGLAEVQQVHARHVIAVEGPALPALPALQMRVLLCAVDGVEVVTGTATQRSALARHRLVYQVAPGQWRLTSEGQRVRRLALLAEREAAARARHGALARTGLVAPQSAT